MRRTAWMGAWIGLAVGLTACKYNKETVPVERNIEAVRVPNQQRIVSLAVDEAVEGLDFAPLAGRSVSIELSGVFPHSEVDMMHYLLQQVEAKLARSGVRVIHPASVLMLPGQPPPPGTTPLGAGTGAALTLSEPADFRILVGVSWGGMDVRDKQRTNEELLIAQVGTVAGTVLGGFTLMNVMDGSNAKILGFAAIFGGPIVTGIWYMHRSPFPHVYTLYGRVRLVANVIPTKEGKAFMTEGRGQSKVVLDETSPEGYMP